MPLVVVFVNGQFFKDTGAGFLFGGYRMAPREIHIVIINPAAVPATAPYKIKTEEGLKVTDSHNLYKQCAVLARMCSISEDAQY